MREDLQDEVAIYEAELNEIRSNLAERRVEIGESSDCGKVLVGYCVTSKVELALVNEHEEKYGFVPVIVLDCTMDEALLTELLAGMQGKDYEVMLTGTPYSAEVLNTADSVRELLPEYGFDDDVSFLLRGADDVIENLDELYEHGYSGLVRYDDSAKNGLTDKGVPFIAYNFISNNDQLSGGLDLVIQNKSAIIMVFDFNSMEDGKLSEADMTTALDDIQKQVSDETLVYSSAKEVLEQIRAGDDLEKVKKQEYEEYAAAQQERIDELEEKIHNIYSEWNEK
ncbi:MAG: hypothetical protein Q4C91_23770 [Eubacteriales bacterium]|nr:hypothetical protein [Eubacteriales bacterium]